MRIIFFGTPAFAVPSLEALLAEQAQVVGVVTQPDKPQGRSRSTLVAPPVKQAAQRHGIPVLQPDRPVGDVFHAALKHWQPELGVVVAYGHILRPAVLSLPTRGMINVHASLLPRLRGAAPINWAILRGEAETGITIMRMDSGMDTGPILHQNSTPIGPYDTAGQLTSRLASLGADSLIEALALMQIGGITPVPQDETLATYAPKIDRAVTRIDWNNTAEAIGRRIRAFDPLPGAWTTLGGHEVKLFSAAPCPGAERSGPGGAGGTTPGEVLAVSPNLTVAAATGTVTINEVQPSGKARMPAEAWGRGRGVQAGQVFE